jgi:hypothetical protein
VEVPYFSYEGETNGRQPFGEKNALHMELADETAGRLTMAHHAAIAALSPPQKKLFSEIVDANIPPLGLAGLTKEGVTKSIETIGGLISRAMGVGGFPPVVVDAIKTKAISLDGFVKINMGADAPTVSKLADAHIAQQIARRIEKRFAEVLAVMTPPPGPPVKAAKHEIVGRDGMGITISRLIEPPAEPKEPINRLNPTVYGPPPPRAMTI